MAFQGLKLYDVDIAAGATDPVASLNSYLPHEFLYGCPCYTASASVMPYLPRPLPSLHCFVL